MKIILLLLAFPMLVLANEKNYRLEDFYEFFGHDKPISHIEISEKFGEPTSISHLYIQDSVEDKKLSRDRAWWYYELPEESRVGIQVDAGKALGVYYFYPGKDADIDKKQIRKQNRSVDSTP